MTLDSNMSLQLIADKLRRLWCAFDATDAGSPLMHRAVSNLDTSVGGLLETQVWKAGDPCHGSTHGCTTPITPETAGLFANYYLGGPRMLAAAYSCPLSRYHGDAGLLERLEASLRYIEPLLRPESPRHGAWYMWDIGYPQELAGILLTAGESLEAKLGDSLMESYLSMPCRIFAVNREGGVVLGAHAGTNMMSILSGLLCRAAVTNDGAWLDCASAQLALAMSRGEDGQGLQDDWSFHFHGRGVNAGYGAHALHLQAAWIYLTHGTVWQCSNELLEKHLGVIRNFYRFNVWRGRSSPYSVDRSIAAPGGFRAEGVKQALLTTIAAELGEEETRMLAGAALQCFPEGRLAEPDGNASIEAVTFFESTKALIERLAEPYHGMRYYPSSEYLLAHRANWFLGIRMSSTRTKTWNAQNGAHILGSSSAEFSVAFMTDGREFDDSVIATMDWGGLMGVTATRAIEQPPEGYGSSSFVDGLADDVFAVMGMQYLLAPPGQDVLRANKSVFVTADSIVMLGNKIRCDADLPVSTTLFQAPMEEGEIYRLNSDILDLRNDGRWELKAGDSLFLRNTWIRILQPATLHFEKRVGNFGALNYRQRAGNNDSETNENQYSRHWFYLRTHHGVKPESGCYGAVLYPAVEPGFIEPSDTLTIVQEDSHHRVDDRASGRGGEVRFPTDYRGPGGASYWGAEPFKWGSIAHWAPSQSADHAELTIVPPLRYLRDAATNTEIFLPDGFEAENVTLVTMEGKPFPRNILSLQANGEPRKMRVRRI